MKKKQKDANYLEFVPMIKENLQWNREDDGSVILVREHKGISSRIAQKVFRMPKETKVHLDEFGNFIWPLIDGRRSIYDIALLVKEEYGEKAEPLYERLCQYFKILEEEEFVVMQQI